MRRANIHGVKLLVDIFHMLRNGESADDILKVAPLIRHAHVAENRDRAAPGVHGDDLRPQEWRHELLRRERARLLRHHHRVAELHAGHALFDPGQPDDAQ